MYVSCTCLALSGAGCGDDDGVGPGADAGPGGDDGGGSAHGTLALDVVGEVAPLEDGQTFESASVWIMELRARNDRGGDYEPIITSPTPIDLARGASFTVADAAPATYSRVSMHLASTGGEPTFAMRIVEATRTFDVRLTAPLDVEASCASPVVLAPGGSARLLVTLRIRDVAKLLDESAVPEPIEGVVHVDEDTAPDAVSALLRKLADAFELSCETVEAGS